MKKKIFILSFVSSLMLLTSLNYAQLIRSDDFQTKSDYWYWRADGNQSAPTVKNGLLKLHLVDALSSEYCNTEIYDPTEPYAPGVQARIRLKCSPQHIGSRGWGFWDGDLDTNSILYDYDVAWVMQQGSKSSEDKYNWSLFGVNGNLLINRQTFDLNNVVDETEWHTYNIIWGSDSTLLSVDDIPQFTSISHLPDENMRLDLWIDNRVINIQNPFEFSNKNSEGSKMLVDFIEISGSDGPAINRDIKGNLLLWESPNTFPNGAKKTLWKEYSFNSPTSGEALLFLTGSAETYNNQENDDNLRIVFDSNDFGWNTVNSLDGSNLRGKGTSLALPLDISAGEHKLDIYSDITPFLRDVIVVFSPDGKVVYNKNFNQMASGDDGLWKSIELEIADSSNVTILISGTGYGNDFIRLELDGKDFGWDSEQAIIGDLLQGLPNTIVVNEKLTIGSHTLKIFKKGNPELFTVAVYGNSTVTNIEKAKDELDLVLLQSNPNPFNISTNITYQISESANVNIKIVNILGQEVTTLVDEFKNKGVHTKIWNADNQTSGIYFCILESSNSFRIEKLLLLK